MSLPWAVLIWERVFQDFQGPLSFDHGEIVIMIKIGFLQTFVFTVITQNVQNRCGRPGNPGSQTKYLKSPGYPNPTKTHGKCKIEYVFNHMI